MSTITLTLVVGGPSLAHSTSAKTTSQNGSLPHVTRPIDAFPGSLRSGSGAPAGPMMPAPPPPEFEFKMRYKYIPQYLAAVRYGVHGSPIERGQLEPGTYCNRILEQCHRRRCKIQSPNYPGLYPRNVSCFFTIRQRDKPQCKRVLVQVSQSRSHKVQLRSLLPGPQMSLASGFIMSPVAANDPTASMTVDTFMTWDECNWTRDRIVIYDGSSADAPVLLSICGGSHIPPVTSSGPEIHIAFYSTPFGNPLGPVPPPPFPAPLRGFELDVDVVLVDSESADYTNSLNCSFYVCQINHLLNWTSGFIGRVILGIFVLRLLILCFTFSVCQLQVWSEGTSKFQVTAGWWQLDHWCDRHGIQPATHTSSKYHLQIWVQRNREWGYLDLFCILQERFS